jgi:crotonobetainyl-CoA:carnitine CoA-transferase CaiB-like acyl-CoA transferase
MVSLDDFVSDPQAHEAGCFVDTPDGWGGSFPAPAAPVRFPATPTGPAGPAPKLGEHTRQVLAEAGYAADEVDALIATGAASDAL